MTRTTRRVLAAATAALALACACTDDGSQEAADLGPQTTTSSTAATTTTTTPEDDRAWPTDSWPTTTPAGAGLDPAMLEDLATQAEAEGSACLVVTRDGELVAEWYWSGMAPDDLRESWSATKSVTATLVGIAADQGHLDIGQPASDFLTEWQGTPSEEVTIRNLLANDSGRYQDDITDYARMATQAEDKSQFAIELAQQHEPGTVWVYNNSAIQTLEEVLERATGQPVDAFAREHLFAPLGMRSRLNVDAAGNALVFMGMQSNCRDMARFGLLYLRDGEWRGEQVVSEEFVTEAVQPSQDLNPAYGYLWWLLGRTDAETAAGQGDVTDEGASGYAALGLGNQIIAVFPDEELVVTRMGNGGDFAPDDIARWAGDID